MGGAKVGVLLISFVFLSFDFISFVFLSIVMLVCLWYDTPFCLLCRWSPRV